MLSAAALIKFAVPMVRAGSPILKGALTAAATERVMALVAAWAAPKPPVNDYEGLARFAALLFDKGPEFCARLIELQTMREQARRDHPFERLLLENSAQHAPGGVTDAPWRPAPKTAPAFLSKRVLASFPDGTLLRGTHKGKQYTGEITGAKVRVRRKSYTSLSAAARAITDRSGTNGWTFWECKLPDSSDWVLVDSLRS